MREGLGNVEEGHEGIVIYRPRHEEEQGTKNEESHQACRPLHDANAENDNQWCKSLCRGYPPRAEVGCW